MHVLNSTGCKFCNCVHMQKCLGSYDALADNCSAYTISMYVLVAVVLSLLLSTQLLIQHHLGIGPT